MLIRELCLADNDNYAALWITALKEQDAFFRISIKDELKPKIPTGFSDESFTLGAFINTHLVGTVSIERDIREKLKHKALLFRMFVHSSASGQGIGRALIAEALSLVKAQGRIRQIYLTVLASNSRAISLYSSIGFKPYAHEPESVNINGDYVDELQMVYFLENNKSE